MNDLGIGPHPVDRHVGRLVCERRISLGLTQSDLAKALGLTFQQIQKYEKGANRISASKLWEIAGALDVEIGAFFNGLPRDSACVVPADEEPLRGRPTRISVEITRLAPMLTTQQQKLILELVSEMSG